MVIITISVKITLHWQKLETIFFYSSCISYEKCAAHHHTITFASPASTSNRVGVSPPDVTGENTASKTIPL